MHKWLASIGCILFMFILTNTYIDLSNIMRYRANDGLDAFYNTEKQFDITYIGPSSAFRYFQPLTAWEKHGFTSFVYADNSMQIESILPAIKEIQRYQKNPIFVISCRPFEGFRKDEGKDTWLARFSHMLPFLSKNQILSVYSYIINHDLSPNHFISLLFDIDIFHNNINEFKKEERWKTINKSIKPTRKGFAEQMSHMYLSTPKEEQITERLPVELESEKTLIELLSYLKKHKIQALFVADPFYNYNQTYERINYIGDIVEASGYPFLNTNTDAYHEQMGLNFAEDFYDRNHVNLYGSYKYTNFFASYLASHFSLPDHRGDPSYAQWDADYAAVKKELDAKEAYLDALIAQHQKEFEMRRDRLQDSEHFEDWFYAAANQNISLILASTDDSYLSCNEDFMALLNGWHVTEQSQKLIMQTSGDVTVYTNETDGRKENILQVEATGFDILSIPVSINGVEPIISIKGDNAAVPGEGLKIVAIDKLRLEVLDSIRVFPDADGNLILSRKAG